MCLACKPTGRFELWIRKEFFTFIFYLKVGEATVPSDVQTVAEEALRSFTLSPKCQKC